MKVKVSFGVTGLLLLGLPSCAALFTPPSVEIVEVGLVSLGLTSGTAAVTLDVTNAGSKDLDLEAFFYEVRVRGPEGADVWTRLAGGVHSERIVIPGEEVQRVTIPFPFEYRALGAALRSFLSSGEVPYRVHGRVSVRRFGTSFDVPFRSEGILIP
ncbi:MAG: LEA type 2 family protein [Gemmatimonadetes bacterium]|nr:LEA type 2 family protein [Gemmatimonadota bacterium]NNM05924.1 LEA type 2 family protein [Gemmatimonadota bacterium]